MENGNKNFKTKKNCTTTQARITSLKLSAEIELPAYMPVATTACLKCSSFKIPYEIILSNTYHCRELGDLKEFTGNKLCMLTDSGGFQIGSLKGAEVVEDGVYFHTGSFETAGIANLDVSNPGPNPNDSDCEAKKRRKVMPTIFTPEDSIKIQNRLNADIIMQLDHVVPPDSSILEEAMHRSLRWLKRCNDAHENALKINAANKADSQLLFPIIQGGVDMRLRRISFNEIMKYDPMGVAIGGLCGGESKVSFCKTVFQCCRWVRDCSNIPIYVMGVGYPEDIFMCILLGADMMDCVYPTRTARFGKMFTHKVDYNMNKSPKEDYNTECSCRTCKYSLHYIHSVRRTTNFSILLTEHNLFYIKKLVERIKKSIRDETVEDLAKEYYKTRFGEIPKWVCYGLRLVNIKI